eukprot:TRINITY_DN44521_c0_g1_i1.p1 TRINITY_DN44521_c0_g1~~TRINITY_DN44521_c0_g1_i1.p1  ORF type:complete len:217 (+),score=52.78 TRINITY_DN44521_c0_g1_i1:99-749(+)
MNKLVHALSELGISTVDGSRVPSGMDWRRFFFPSLSRAVVFVPILSDSFLLSAACEDEITYAWDKKKVILPVLHDLVPFQQVLTAPQDFVRCRADIEEVIPKLESFLNQCNRTPANGCFEDDWDVNVHKLAQAIKHNLATQSPEQAPSSAALCSSAISLRSDSGEQLVRTQTSAARGVVELITLLQQPKAAHVSVLGDLRYVCRDRQSVQLSLIHI